MDSATARKAKESRTSTKLFSVCEARIASAESCWPCCRAREASVRLGDGREGSVNIACWATDSACAVSPFGMMFKPCQNDMQSGG